MEVEAIGGTRIYCNRHYLQMHNHGHCFKSIFDENDFIEHDDYVEMIVFYKNQQSSVLLSSEACEKVKLLKWHLRPDGYVESREENKETILLHRYLTNFKYSTVDHINRNKLDNRLENLRGVTTSQNQINKSIQSNNTSGITGVSYDKERMKWHVMITANKKSINIGRFDKFDDAVSARLCAEKIYHKEYIPKNRDGEYLVYEKQNK